MTMKMIIINYPTSSDHDEDEDGDNDENDDDDDYDDNEDHICPGARGSKLTKICPGAT